MKTYSTASSLSTVKRMFGTLLTCKTVASRYSNFNEGRIGARRFCISWGSTTIPARFDYYLHAYWLFRVDYCPASYASFVLPTHFDAYKTRVVVLSWSSLEMAHTALLMDCIACNYLLPHSNIDYDTLAHLLRSVEYYFFDESFFLFFFAYDAHATFHAAHMLSGMIVDCHGRAERWPLQIQFRLDLVTTSFHHLRCQTLRTFLRWRTAEVLDALIIACLPSSARLEVVNLYIIWSE